MDVITFIFQAIKEKYAPLLMCHMPYLFLIIISYNGFVNVIICAISCHIACKISLNIFTVFFVGVEMRHVGGVNHKTVVQVVAIQSILETLRLIKS